MTDYNSFKGQSFSKLGAFSNNYRSSINYVEADIKKLIELGFSHVHQANEKEDQKGGDYLAKDFNGRQVYIDVKRREKGCSKYWKNGIPEVAIEFESVCAGGKYNIKEPRIGWSFDDKKITDWIVYLFDESDFKSALYIDFKLLYAALHEFKNVLTKKYKLKYQDSGQWESSAMFVPILDIFDLIDLLNTDESKEFSKLSMKQTINLAYSISFP